MKTPVAFLLLLVSANLGFAQGKLRFQLNIDNLLYFNKDTSKLLAVDANKTVYGFALAGSSMYTGAGSTVAALAGSPSFVAALFAGTSASSL